VKVIATEDGFDNIAVRHVGEEFDMPDDVFDPRPKLDDHGRSIAGLFYDPPSWFEPVDAALKAKLAKPLARRTLSVNPKTQEADHQASLRAAADREQQEAGRSAGKKND
jgi:hypothetical protein